MEQSALRTWKWCSCARAVQFRIMWQSDQYAYLQLYQRNYNFRFIITPTIILNMSLLMWPTCVCMCNTDYLGVGLTSLIMNWIRLHKSNYEYWYFHDRLKVFGKEYEQKASKRHVLKSPHILCIYILYMEHIMNDTDISPIYCACYISSEYAGSANEWKM